MRYRLSQMEANVRLIDSTSSIDWSGMQAEYHLMKKASIFGKNVSFQTYCGRPLDWGERLFPIIYRIKNAVIIHFGIKK